MIEFEVQETIERPVEAVFEFVLDPDRYGEWTSMQSRRLDQGPLRAGSRFSAHFPLEPEPVDVTMEYTAVERPHHAAFRTLEPADLSWSGTFDFEALGTSTTRLVVRSAVKLSGTLAALEPMWRDGLQQGEQEELLRLKTILEQGAASGVQPGVEPAASGR